MHWIFLSPHLDDAALSCGGFITERIARGDSVEIWTIFAGDPPDGPLSPFASELHQRWGAGREAIAVRRAEDVAACQVLGAASRHFAIPDCIYRRDPSSGDPLIQSREDLFRPLPESQASMVEELSGQLTANLSGDCELVSPITLGNHIDHQLVHQAAERLKRRLWFYADFPYAVDQSTAANASIPIADPAFLQPISPAALRIWQSAVAEYRSQISSFWESVSEMEKAIQAYLEAGGGCKLWSNSPLTA